jgi:hypothetical protein
MNKLQELQADFDYITQSIAMHEARIETFGKPNHRGRTLIFHDVDPKVLLIHLYKIRAELEAEISTASKAPRKRKSKA